MTKVERDRLIKLARVRAKQAEREAEARQATLLAEVQDQLTAEFDAHDKLWSDAVTVAEKALDKANAQIRLKCAELGIPAGEAPQLMMGWRSRSPSYTDRERRAELRKLAETRLYALTNQRRWRSATSCSTWKPNSSPVTCSPRTRASFSPRCRLSST